MLNHELPKRVYITAKDLPMKLGILIYSLSGGGAERVVSNLLTYLMDENIDVHLIVMNPTIHYQIPKATKIHYLENSKPAESNFYKLFKIPLLAYKYSRLIRKLQLTHSFSLLTRPNYINILARAISTRKYKLIISERGQPSIQYGSSSLQSKVNRFLMKLLYNRADMILCNSLGNCEDVNINFHVPRNRIKVINNPIDIKTISQIRPISNYFDPKFFNIITIGRLTRGKNHKLLIDSVEKIKNVRLYILGQAELEKELQEQIIQKKLNDKVFLLGFDSNPFQYLKAADLFIFGSNHEGFPNVLLEAMACGLPILSTNCKSGPDEIMELSAVNRNDIMITKYGILTPPENKDLMIKGIQYFMNNPDFLNNCRKNANIRAKDFRKEIILKKYKEKLFNIK